MAYAVLALCLVAGLGLMGRWLLNAEPRDILRAARWLGGALAIGLALFVLLRGRLEWLIYIAPFALPFLVRGGAILRALRNAAKMSRGPSPGQSSDVRTRWLAMTLDHDSGTMDGEVLRGPFVGRRLSDLAPEELAELAHELDGDTESRQVFDAWIERMGADMGGAEAPPGAADASAMTPARAREILGVAEEADEKEIREAHRRLMLANHPDRGGSSWLAAEINRAKDVLLGRR
ncbi:MAG: DnaJ domain-containing protein [Thalassobaculaceae bacterium]|nr:DnaJ domain-containing protein [Thalassobaculaceae bacterium]